MLTTRRSIAQLEHAGHEQGGLHLHVPVPSTAAYGAGDCAIRQRWW